MALPKQVQRYGEEVEQLEQQLQAQKEPQEETPKEEKPLPENVVESNDTFDDQPETYSEDEPETDETVETDPEEGIWESRYKHLEGKYRAEVPRLHNELKELRAALEQLQAQPQPVQQEEPAEESYVTADDIDSFGEDLIDLQRRVAREVSAEFKKELAKLYKENEQLRSQVTEVRGSSFETKLEHAIPDWAELNKSQDWIAWLDEFDPMIQGPRRTVAQAAYSRGDIQAVKTYVDLFKQTARKPKKTDRSGELRKQVQPRKATANTAHDSSGVIYTAAEAESVFDDIQRLINKGNMEKAAELEHEISAAYAEGRVTG